VKAQNFSPWISPKQWIKYPQKRQCANPKREYCNRHNAVWPERIYAKQRDRAGGQEIRETKAAAADRSCAFSATSHQHIKLNAKADKKG